jgi:hypothetical protein
MVGPSQTMTALRGFLSGLQPFRPPPLATSAPTTMSAQEAPSSQLAGA